MHYIILVRATRDMIRPILCPSHFKGEDFVWFIKEKLLATLVVNLRTMVVPSKFPSLQCWDRWAAATFCFPELPSPTKTPPLRYQLHMRNRPFQSQLGPMTP